MGHLFGSMLRRMEALPLPAWQARQAGETNLDDEGKLTGRGAANKAVNLARWKSLCS